MGDLTGLATRVLAAARAKGLRLGTVESCTGGLIAGALTEIAGSSDVVEGGIVTYSNDLKTLLVGVPAETLAAHGAVSAQTAGAMVGGLLARVPTVDLAVAVTGIAGPSGGSAEKPVGLVYLACQRRGNAVQVERQIFPGDRAEIRRATVNRALQMLLEPLET
ncbi:competence damage-inducible protein A [Elstera cyanobacteriorum]|uniref:Damage-inducible protein CinA n=1 Tax=Elstera cyanobacteriorum TaxID=2022747 RepID=A0A255XP51_9PROT|nr:CinA family protein [Elstera cyanobacteriorum]OYQ18758.1 damage-inducible protein CinA [Elstera cyanobacteriorum]GFZ77912.1 competence damage-inducible protein A [Elstera cyanobacteriorum]